MGTLTGNFVCKKRTICEVHREMYDIIERISEVMDTNILLELLHEANNMAKKMSNKLYEYHYNVSEKSSKNQNYEKSLRVRAGRE